MAKKHKVKKLLHLCTNVVVATFCERLIRHKIKKAKNLQKRKLAIVLAIILSVSLISAIFAGYLFGFSNVGNALKYATKSGIKTVITPPTGHVLKVLVVNSCNDDGTLCSTADKGYVLTALHQANLIFTNSNSKIRFVLDPRSNTDAVLNEEDEIVIANSIKNTLLNQDCTIPSGVIPEKITQKDVNNDGKFNIEDVKLVCDPTSTVAARTAYALNYPDAVVAFARGNSIYAKYNEAAGHWEIKMSNGGSSGCGSPYINMPSNFGGVDKTLFTHESGHYFCSPHTFGAAPKTIEDAAKRIKDYISKKHITNIADTEAVLRVFDLDAGYNVYDTPPDPGTTLFEIQYGDVCKIFPKNSSEYKGIQIPVYFSPKVQKTYVLRPDRKNIMSYYKGCGPDFSFHFTSDQNKRHEMAISTYHKCFIDKVTAACSSNSKFLTADAKLTAKPSVDELNNLIALRSKNIAGSIRSGQKLSITVADKEIFPNPADILPSIIAEMQEEYELEELEK